MTFYKEIVFFLLLSNVSFAQKDSSRFINYGLKIAYVYNNKNGYEIGIVRSSSESNFSTFISSDIIYNKSQVWVEPKLGIEGRNLFLWGYKLSVADLTNFNNHSLRIIPEVSFGFVGIIYLAYGYNFGIINSKEVNNSGHRLSLTVNYPLFHNVYAYGRKFRGLFVG